MVHTFHSVSAHRKAVLAILHGGSARGYRANIAATLWAEKVYCMSVLLKDMASLILTSKEEKLLDQQYKVHLQRLLKLHQATPTPVLYFLTDVCLLLPRSTSESSPCLASYAVAENSALPVRVTSMERLRLVCLRAR